MVWFKYSIYDGTRYFREISKNVDIKMLWIFFKFWFILNEWKVPELKDLHSFF